MHAALRLNIDTLCIVVIFLYFEYVRAVSVGRIDSGPSEGTWMPSKRIRKGEDVGPALLQSIRGDIGEKRATAAAAYASAEPRRLEFPDPDEESGSKYAFLLGCWLSYFCARHVWGPPSKYVL